MDEEQQREQADLISRLFALTTMKMEDAAEIAADCQSLRPIGELREGAGKLDALIGEAGTVLAGIFALLQGDQYRRATATLMC